ncbi:hypothetical protein QBC34DRAFT_188082 [Podospora aff. communis PSN243]|uniref:Uncharacterized protein n=1 Tax=Podospora aff. communis PSN243 TaxID=3040156 RepID=A0AAV9G6E0_9PEZI|nr:hypothetical protein QBC34DRAFT_188082 [Podospora aff. communis PSN243]
MSTAMEYISKRRAPATAPTNTIEHTVALSSPTARIPFPTPEALWESRDVTREDWRVFSEQLHPQGTQTADQAAADGESDAAFQRRVKYVVEEWNAEFFKPRCLRVKIDFGEKKAEGGPKGLGFKVGNAFVGISTSNSGGVGLKLPGGVLLGVATGNKTEEKK